MTLNDREKFMVLMMTMITSPTAKLLSRTARMSLIKHLRNKLAPSVTDNDWHTIKLDIDGMQEDILAFLTKDAIRSLNESPSNMEPELMALEKEGKELMNDINEEDAEKAGIGDLFRQVKDHYKKGKEWRH